MVRLFNNSDTPLGLRAGADGYIEVLPKAQVEITEQEAEHFFVQNLIKSGELVKISEDVVSDKASEGQPQPKAAPNKSLSDLVKSKK